VAVALSRELGVLRLSMADNDPGIPQAQAQRSLVFERFYRGGDHDAPGSGLGLAIVTQAVTRLRGTVSLRDGLHGRGCTFVVEIPAVGGAIRGGKPEPPKIPSKSVKGDLTPLGAMEQRTDPT